MQLLKQVLFALLTALSFLSANLLAQENPPAGDETVILDTSGYWRRHYTWKPPAVQTAAGIQLGKQTTGKWINRETPAPPDGWMSPDFDDSGWVRLPGMPFPPVYPDWVRFKDVNFGFSLNDLSSPYLAHLAMRGKFEVTDPARVKELTLSLRYRGGVVVYLNGKEAARGHMPPGVVRADTFAEGYPAEAFSAPEGGRLEFRKHARTCPKRVRLHNRSLRDVRIPAGLLRRGVNVLAISVHRAPCHEVVLKQQGPGRTFTLTWSTCGLSAARLTASAVDGVVPNTVRPKGVQVWNSNVMAVDFDLDWGDPCEKPDAISIVGTRNGAFSGKVVLGSDRPIKGLAAKMSDLQSKDGATIAASAVQVRYALPDRSDWLRGADRCGFSARYPARATAFDGLAEKAPAEVPVRTSRSGRGTWVAPGQPKFVFGAVQPVWVTVAVPADARPGRYTGTLAVSAGGRNFSLPVRLRVCGWRLPDTQDFTTFTELIQSPESVALCYNTPLWSDEHFQKMEKSFKLIGQLGSRSLYLPLICKTNFGNAESMVRWIRTGEKSYRYDLKPLERYIEIAEKHMGKPKVVCLYVWDMFLEGSHRHAGATRAEGVPVTLFDPATGKTEEISLPSYTTPEGKALWTPLLRKVRELLKKHGLEREVMLGMMGDYTPTKKMVEAFAEMAPGLPWILHAHGTGESNVRGAALGYKAYVFPVRFPQDPDERRTTGWRREDLYVQFPRGPWNQRYLTNYRLMAEMNIAGQQRGFGRMGGDFFPVLRDKRGRKFPIAAQFPKSSWRNLNILSCLLKAGPDGALSSHCFEMMREGVQECEARIFIERAILEKTIDRKLAQRCQDMLDERTRAVLRGYSSLRIDSRPNSKWVQACTFHGAGYAGSAWYPGSGWEEHLGNLYSAAAAVAAELGVE